MNGARGRTHEFDPPKTATTEIANRQKNKIDFRPNAPSSLKVHEETKRVAYLSVRTEIVLTPSRRGESVEVYPPPTECQECWRLL